MHSPTTQKQKFTGKNNNVTLQGTWYQVARDLNRDRLISNFHFTDSSMTNSRDNDGISLRVKLYIHLGTTENRKTNNELVSDYELLNKQLKRHRQ